MNNRVNKTIYKNCLKIIQNKKLLLIPPININETQTFLKCDAIQTKQLLISTLPSNIQTSNSINNYYNKYLESRLDSKLLKEIIKTEFHDEKNKNIDGFESIRYLNSLIYVNKKSNITNKNGIKIITTGLFDQEISKGENGNFYHYRIIIENNSDKRIQLLGRKWIFSSESEEGDDSWSLNVPSLNSGINFAPGVLGETPIFEPGDSFSYMSSCKIKHKEGIMNGRFNFCELNNGDIYDKMSDFKMIEVPIPETILSRD